MSAVILAGGRSTRLGEDKSLLLVDGEPLLARVVNRLSALSDDLIIVTNHRAQYEPLALGARLIPDAKPGVGALMGLYSGLRAARCSYAFMVACDMPFLNLALLGYMMGLVDGYDIVVPRVGEFIEPLHAIYGTGCLTAIERMLAKGRRQIVSFFGEVRVRYVEQVDVDRFDPDHLSFVNVNTPDDWAEVQKLLNDR